MNAGFWDARKITYHPDALRFIDRQAIRGQVFKRSVKAAIDTLVRQLHDTGLWSKLYALFPFVGNNPTAQALDLINPTGKQMQTYVGAPTYSWEGCDISNGSQVITQALTKELIPVTDQFTFGAYYKRRAPTSQVVICTLLVGQWWQLGIYGGGLSSLDSPGSSRYGWTDTMPAFEGFICGRRNKTLAQVNYGSTMISGQVDPGNAYENLQWRLKGTVVYKAWFFAQYLTDAETQTLNNLITAFQTALNRPN
jgi:hypothetical protein